MADSASVPLLQAPAAAPRRRFTPVLMMSVLAHVGVVLLCVLDERQSAIVRPPQEIPVELVQAPPPPAQPAQQPVPKRPDADEARRDAQRAADERKAQDAKRAEDARKAEEAQRTRDAQRAQETRRAKDAQKVEERRKAQEARKSPDASKPVKEADNQPPKSSSESVEQRMNRLIGPMAAIPLPAAAADGTESATYKELVLSQVAKAKKVGRYQGVPGVTNVRFSIADDGSLARCEIVGQSADPSLDAEALAMVRRAAPFPSPPPGARREFVIGLRFQALPSNL